jgi:succinate dehydrogenase/fumarate reductase-like Fe-S protein
MCSVTCPKNLDPQYAINELLKMLGDLRQRKASTAL